MKQRSTIVVCALLVTGLVITFSEPEHRDPKTEPWMIENSVTEMEGYLTEGGVERSDVSYVMDEVTYRTLEPYGIVARVFQSKSTVERYDVVLIASQSKDSFHDPRVCFSAQGWALSNQWTDTVRTETRGDIPITIAVMDGPTGNNKLAAFLYKGPKGIRSEDGFYGTTKGLKLGMFLEQLKGGNDLDGVFYRFIPLHRTQDQIAAINDMKKFIAQYLDKSGESSEGYF